MHDRAHVLAYDRHAHLQTPVANHTIQGYDIDRWPTMSVEDNSIKDRLKFLYSDPTNALALGSNPSIVWNATTPYVTCFLAHASAEPCGLH